MFKKVGLIILLLICINPVFVEAKSGYLYDVLKNEAENGELAREYTGEHHDSFTVEPSKNIYHWYAENDTDGTAILDKNNVIFANHCWQMIRTTDTGGVKMIYNGEAVDNQCLSTRGTHVGYASRTSQNLASNYWYGTDYTYDSTNHLFQITGITEKVTWNATTAPGLVGKYTCKDTNEDGTCSTLYLVESYYNASSAYVIPLISSSHYSQFGQLQFNANYGSLADVGYMYNTRYLYNEKKLTSEDTIFSRASLSTSYWYANDIVWGSPTANKYNLDNPYQINSTTDYPNLVGKYTFRNATENYTSTSVYYIAAVSGTTMYYIQLNNTGSHTLNDYNYTYTYGDSYTDNGNGTYTINNANTFNRIDWNANYTKLWKKYVCKNAINDTCSDLWYAVTSDSIHLTYIKIDNNYKYAKSYTWDGSKYILDSDTSVSFWNISDATNLEKLYNAHYTCWNTTGECTTISYIYGNEGYAAYIYYINLKNGKGIEDAKNEMLYDDDVNTTNSTIKDGVEAWYKKNLLKEYNDYIEDTIYCNDRSQKNADTNAWNPNGGILSTNISFYGSGDLSCPNVTDKFSTLNEKAMLNYKVGLMSYREMSLLNQNNARKTGQYYWLGSPYFLYVNHPYGWYARSDGGMGAGTQGNISTTRGVRPAISLKTKTIYKSGNGSMENPYIIGDASKNNIIMNNNNMKGTVSNLDNTTDIYELSDVTFTVTPKKGYYVERLDIENSNHETIDYEVNGNDYTFQMPDSDVTIIPIYEKIKSSINIQVVDETEDLNIEINDLTKVEYEEEVIFKVTPIKGYKITNIKIIDSENHEINYSKTSNKNEYKFIMPDSDVTIIPSYEKVKNSVVVDKDTQSKEIIIKVEDATAVVYEDRVKFTVIAEEGYEVENILITDKEGNKIEYKKTDKDNEYEFIMPDSDVIIQPLFKKIADPNYIINPETGRNCLFFVLIMIIIFTIKITKRKRLSKIK